MTRSAAGEQKSLLQTNAFSLRLTRVAEQLLTDPDRAELVFNLLSQVVFPTQRGEAFPYLVPIVGEDAEPVADSEENAELRSLSRILAEAAVACEKSDQLQSVLEQRRKVLGADLATELVAVHLAMQTSDAEAAGKALSAMAGLTQSRLSDGTVQPKVFPADQTIEVANLLLHASLPAADLIGNDPVTHSIFSELLHRAGNSRPLALHSGLFRRITQHLCTQPSPSMKARMQILDSYFKSVRRIDVNPMRLAAARREGEARKQLLNWAFAEPQLETAAVLLRQTAESIKNQGLKHDQEQDLVQTAIRLMKLSAGQRYELLCYVILADDESEVIDWSNYVLYAIPPPELRAAMPVLEQLRLLPTAHPDLPLTSLSLLLAQAAAETGKTDELVSRLRQRTKRPGDETHAMIGLAKAASGDLKTASRILAEVHHHLADQSSKTIPFASAFLAARLLDVDPELASQTLAQDLALVRASELHYVRTFFNRMLAKYGDHADRRAQAGSPLKHFLSVQVPHATRGESAFTDPVYAVDGKSIRYAGGSDENLLMLKYPLRGDYTFAYRCVHHGWSDSGLALGNIAYRRSGDKRFSAHGLIDRGISRFPCDAFLKERDVELSLRVRADKVSVYVDGDEILSDQVSAATPFVSIHLLASNVCEMADVRLEGDVQIPRQVDLVDDRLRGWSTHMLRASLPNINLSISPDEDSAAAKRIRQTTPAQEATRRAWFADKGILKSGRPEPNAPAGMAHIQYLRPLCSGETISYEFRYLPGSLEVHPVIGRTVLLLRAAGVKLRWLPVAESQESSGLDPTHEIDPAAGEAADHFKLKPNEWNQVKLTATESGVSLNVNGADICHVRCGREQKFGVFHEKQRACEIRNIVLSGSWPQAVPENLMQPK